MTGTATGILPARVGATVRPRAAVRPRNRTDYHGRVISGARDDDEALVAIAGGDQEAFARFYDMWSGRIFALVLQIVVDRAQSEEVLQEIFLEVWRRADSFDPSRGSSRAWLVTLARRRAIDRVRAAQAARERDNAWIPFEPDHDTTLRQVEERIVSDEVRAALVAVGEPHRTTIELAYFTGMTHSQIAAHCGVPLGTVKTRIRDGLAKLRKQMEVDR
ncbi:sigma-70 family RNA polymerase sigma factor [Schaalia sp. 19OD2882]|uniref:sigma-70 family RNA polymerase sigma factor n=1 Tax=Schaalia sp. 19OD2882 TaxID=2794089 RepID=UPI001C1F0405|nr:sigma-70 family RNA polymerase sigma factor [Schaalia sp. 19OD2882]QWW20113.1 sigma-70 family RNA polymerase sigma factor [Schaalia sp. 19OD2882]